MGITKEQFDKVVELKKLRVTISEISSITGVSKYEVKEISKEEGLLLTKEERERNITKGRYGVEKPNIATNTASYLEKMAKRKEVLIKDVEKIIHGKEITLVSIDSHKKHQNMTFNCKLHGDFKRNYYLILKTQDCPRCVIKNKPQCMPYTYSQVQKMIEDRGFKLISKEYLSSTEKIEIQCLKHGIFKMALYAFNNGQSCYKCSACDSKPEKEVFEYVSSLGIKAIRKDRDKIKEIRVNSKGIAKNVGVEMDIYIPDRNFAIEYSGIYHHSEKLVNIEINKKLDSGKITKENVREIKSKFKEEHYNKFKKLEENGISLLAIFGDEWSNKKDLIKSMIRYRLGIYNKKIRASKLVLNQLKCDKKVSEFFKKSHLDGSTIGSFAYALMDGDDIISCMSFRKNLETGMMEIARFATLPDYKVYGAFSKLLNNFPRDVDLLSYSNNRVGNGNVYKKHGFIQVEYNDPKIGYCYTDQKIRVSRNRCQKINDSEVLKLYPTEEAQALAGLLSNPFGHNRPIHKLYDYGIKKWILLKKQ